MKITSMVENGDRLQAEAEAHIAHGESGRGTKQLAAQRAGPARVASTIWLIGAEICERLDGILAEQRVDPDEDVVKVKDPR